MKLAKLILLALAVSLAISNCFLVNELGASQKCCPGDVISEQKSLDEKLVAKLTDRTSRDLDEAIGLLSLRIGSRDLGSDSLASALNNRAIAYRLKGLHHLAVLDYNRAIDLKPDFAAAYSNRGLAHAKMELYDLAIEDYNQAIRLEPDNPTAYLKRGNAYYDKEAFDLAISDYTKAIELKPDLLMAYYNRYGAYEKKGHGDDAAKDLGKVLELDPEFGSTKSTLRYAICGRRSCVIREDPSPRPSRDPPVWTPTPGPTLPPEESEWQRLQRQSTNANNKGVEYHNQGDYDRAIPLYEEALRLNPNNATAKSNLVQARTERANKIGLGYYNQGDYEKAIQSYEEALRFDPDNPVAQQKLREAKAALAERGAKAKLDRMLDQLTAGFGEPKGSGPSSSSTGSPEFIGSGESLFSKGSKESAPVDLTFLDPNKPIVVDPQKVKGTTLALRQSQRLSEIAKDLPLFTEEEIRHLFATIQNQSKWPGPKNYEPPLINPLRDPERAKAMYEADRTWLEYKMKPKVSQEFFEKFMSDEKVTRAYDRIRQEQAKSEVAAMNKAFANMGKELVAVAKKSGVEDVLELHGLAEKDPKLKAEINLVYKRADERIKQGIGQARQKAADELLVELEKFKKASGVSK